MVVKNVLPHHDSSNSDFKKKVKFYSNTVSLYFIHAQKKGFNFTVEMDYMHFALHRQVVKYSVTKVK